MRLLGEGQGHGTKKSCEHN